MKKGFFKLLINKKNAILLLVVIVGLVAINMFFRVQSFSFAASDLKVNTTETQSGGVITINHRVNEKLSGEVYKYNIVYDVTNLNGFDGYVFVTTKTSADAVPSYRKEIDLEVGQVILVNNEYLGSNKNNFTTTIEFYDKSGKLIDITEAGIQGRITTTYSKENIRNNDDYNDYDKNPYTKFVASVTGDYTIELWGAEGSYFPSSNESYAGKGAYTKGTVHLNAGDVLYFYKGENANKNITTLEGGKPYYSSATHGGGGGTIAYAGGHHMSSGGGATDVRYFGSHEPTEADLKWDSQLGLRSRIMVAGGGGGTLQQMSSEYDFLQISYGGAAGGLVGYPAKAVYKVLSSGKTEVWPGPYPYGGGQTSGGTGGGICDITELNGTFGLGGKGGDRTPPKNNQECYDLATEYQSKHYDLFSNRFEGIVTEPEPGYGNIGGGGGGGYYGGGGGSMLQDCHAGGAGGSSYISGHQGAVAIKSDGTSKCTVDQAKTDQTCSVHYSGLQFTDTVMIDGEGYSWTTEKGSSQAMPKPDGGYYPQATGEGGIVNRGGNEGNGAFRITGPVGESTENATVVLQKYTKNTDNTETTWPVVGAKYELYDAQTNQLIETYVTNKEGKITINDLLHGQKYYLKEVYVPSSYEIDTNKHEFTADKNKAVSLTVYDKAKPGKVELEKTNESGEHVSGIVFELYYDAATDVKIGNTYTTDFAGLIKVENLKWGNYYFKEISVPDGYIKNTKEIKFTIDKDSVTKAVHLDVVNERTKGSVKLIKYDIDEKNKLPNATFDMYREDGVKVRSNLKTDSKGELLIENISWGSYYLVEVAPPTGYSATKENVRFVINKDNTDIVQEIQTHDSTQEKSIVVKKRINLDEIVFAHGEPTFIFSLKGVDINQKQHQYYQSVTFTEVDVENWKKSNPDKKYIEKEAVFGSLTAGTYTLTELSTVRYGFNKIIDVTAGTVSDETVVFDLKDNAKHEGKATYVNNITNQSGVNHTVAVVNNIKASSKLTYLTAQYNQNVKVAPGHAVNRNDITVVAYYDDGTSAKLANSSYKLYQSGSTTNVLDNDIIPLAATGSYNILISYTEDGITKYASVNVPLIPTHKVIVSVTGNGTLTIKNESTNNTYTYNKSNTSSSTGFLAAEGDKLTVTAKADTDWELKTLKNGNNNIGSGSKITVGNSEITITATFEEVIKIVDIELKDVADLSKLATSLGGYMSNDDEWKPWDNGFYFGMCVSLGWSNNPNQYCKGDIPVTKGHKYYVRYRGGNGGEQNGSGEMDITGFNSTINWRIWKSTTADKPCPYNDDTCALKEGIYTANSSTINANFYSTFTFEESAVPDNPGRGYAVFYSFDIIDITELEKALGKTLSANDISGYLKTAKDKNKNDHSDQYLKYGESVAFKVDMKTKTVIWD